MATISFNGTPLHTVGQLPPVGSQAPDFTVTKIDLSEISLQNYMGKKILLNIFPSLDTATCASAMVKFNEIAEKFSNILILCVSADLPFAQNRFCVSHRLANIQPASIFRHPTFGEKYGVTISDGPLSGLLSRAIVIIDEHGKIIYTQQVDELAHEPDYDAIVKALQLSSESSSQ